MDTLAYFTDDGFNALPFDNYWPHSLPSESIDTQPLPADCFSTTEWMGYNSYPETFSDASPASSNSTSSEEVQDQSQQVLNDGYGPQSSMRKRESAAAADTPEPAQRKRRGRQPETEEKNQARQKERGRCKVQKPPSRSKETRIRQQNKEAAIRSRRRKCQGEEELKSKEQDLEYENRRLALHCNSLKEEIYHIKEQLLRHSNCGCVLIQEFIANEAKRSVGRLAASEACSPPCSSSSAVSPCQSGSISSRASSAASTHVPAAEAQGAERVSGTKLQPLYAGFFCNDEAVGGLGRLGSNETRFGDWDISSGLDTMGNEVSCVNVEFGYQTMDATYV